MVKISIIEHGVQRSKGWEEGGVPFTDSDCKLSGTCMYYVYYMYISNITQLKQCLWLFSVAYTT